jgi:hypothetical protein
MSYPNSESFVNLLLAWYKRQLPKEKEDGEGAMNAPKAGNTTSKPERG